MRHVIIIIQLIIIYSLLGCAANIHSFDNDMKICAYDSDIRSAYIFKKGENSYAILSEPSPDVVKEYTGSISAATEAIGKITDANLKYQYGSKVVDLARRSQSLQILRESLFRLSEMYINGAIPDEKTPQLYDRVLKAVEVIAAVELSQSNVPNEFKESYYSEIMKGNLTDTENEKNND